MRLKRQPKARQNAGESSEPRRQDSAENIVVAITDRAVVTDECPIPFEMPLSINVVACPPVSSVEAVERVSSLCSAGVAPLDRRCSSNIPTRCQTPVFPNVGSTSDVSCAEVCREQRTDGCSKRKRTNGTPSVYMSSSKRLFQDLDGEGGSAGELCLWLLMHLVFFCICPLFRLQPGCVGLRTGNVFRETGNRGHQQKMADQHAQMNTLTRTRKRSVADLMLDTSVPTLPLKRRRFHVPADIGCQPTILSDHSGSGIQSVHQCSTSHNMRATDERRCTLMPTEAPSKGGQQHVQQHSVPEDSSTQPRMPFYPSVLTQVERTCARNCSNAATKFSTHISIAVSIQVISHSGVPGSTYG